MSVDVKELKLKIRIDEKQAEISTFYNVTII